MPKLLKVAVPFDTAHDYSRSLLRGIARYAGNEQKWLIYVVCRGKAQIFSECDSRPATGRSSR